ncbi:MAG: pyridoxamine 5'-phosphate oxidase family protein [Candidatus Lokiarchaeota archaeon]|nr:pyridoxamine 5'-phosphate oxidase family protein [Candidatus Lokiarchaeota archaeon]MBD3340979.1 pyridoxamine 5'-phosphate oxidase family protein [Candidatus Lokiarchaeota archaeon]
MRRKDKEIKEDDLIERIIKEAKVCRIGLSLNNRPYLIPMNFGYKNKTFYLHSYPTGKKIEIFKKNPYTCVEIDTKHEIKISENPCEFSMNYYSLIAFGKADFIEDIEEKKNALDIIVNHYAKGIYKEYPLSVIKKLTLIKIKIEKITGKKSGY